MDFFHGFEFLHTLLPYLPKNSRQLISVLLFFMELSHMTEDFRNETNILNSAPPNPKFPDTDTLIDMMTKSMPKSEAEKIRRMIDMMKILQSLEPDAPKEELKSPKEGTAFGGFDAATFMKMMSPAQQEMFEKYKNMFKSEEA